MAAGATGRLAVLGHPVSHSRSPAMQNAALADLGIDWRYEAIDVEPEGFDGLVRGLPERGFVGVNVTVPHKEAALRLADGASDAARAIGAANTLTFTERGILADNTDAPGLIDSLADSAGDLSGRPALALGAGGAGRAVVWALVRAGAEVTLWNRTHSKAEALAAELGADVLPVEQRGQMDPGRFDVIVNASAAGLGGGDGLSDLPLDEGGFRAGQTVVDMVYGDGPGTLLEAAERGGAEVVDGLEILVRQGARSLRIWTGREPDLDVMRRAARSGG
ncbi:MAG: shikimate dehydrogenase [Solirubrobacterales bacterium]|nr:shikimate dehydrogenase [Solirubrobacterales bacterium]